MLAGLELDVPAGTSVAPVGGTASGKSTVAARRGAVPLDGVDVREFRLSDLRRAVSIVFEDTFLFTDSVRANIAYGDPGADDEEVIRAVRLAVAHEFLARLPDGYETILGERGFSLSSGKHQRLAIARAILPDPTC